MQATDQYQITCLLPWGMMMTMRVAAPHRRFDDIASIMERIVYQANVACLLHTTLIQAHLGTCNERNACFISANES